MVAYVIDFAKKHGLQYHVDDVKNVIIRKPATKGNEKKPGVVLQAHLDMVPQKNSATVHDFEKDPIQAYVDGEWVRAKGTTLGADNGIGVAASLAVLESKDIPHGPIEVIFTIDEETGMTGAFNLKSDAVQGRILLNLNSEDEGELYIGCAGGMNTLASLPVKNEPTPGGYKAFKINLTGLKGGHSGVDIHLGRGNANKLMNRVLWQASREMGIRIASIEGGNLRNAIPRESFATVALPSEKETSFLLLVENFKSIFKNELSSVEPDLQLEAIPVSTPATVIDTKSQHNFLNAIYATPNGAMRMLSDMPEIVETSTNLAIVKLLKDHISIESLLRSSVDSAKIDLGNAMTSVYELAGASVIHEGTYPGWKPNVDSPILTTMKRIYKENFGMEPEVKVIHAGLECGIIGDAVKGMDMISFGPTIRHPHSPDEKGKYCFRTKILEISR